MSSKTENKITNRSFRRRELFALSGAAGLGLAASRIAFGATCAPTAAQTEGPFYPIRPQADRDWDLTQVDGREALAIGEVIVVGGQVTDTDCQPLANALVEIWQACHSGRYNHPRDPNPAELDPNFQYWGRVMTDQNGEYVFKTIIPGAYPANETWTRPPHIHFKVTAPGQRSFTTQMYFAGEPLNDADLILQSLTPAQRDQVIVGLDRLNPHLEPVARFDIRLNIDGLDQFTPELD